MGRPKNHSSFTVRSSPLTCHGQRSRERFDKVFPINLRQNEQVSSRVPAIAMDIYEGTSQYQCCYGLEHGDFL